MVEDVALLLVVVDFSRAAAATIKVASRAIASIGMATDGDAFAFRFRMVMT